MNVFTISFFGHRIIDNPLVAEKALDELIQKLLREKEYVVFLVGRDGDFDQLVSSSVRCCKQKIRADNSSLVWVMPYTTTEFRDNEGYYQTYYDEIEVCESSANVHYKAAFQNRNRTMIDRSDYIIFYVQRRKGGAYQTMQYANKQGKSILNLYGKIE